MNYRNYGDLDFHLIFPTPTQKLCNLTKPLIVLNDLFKKQTKRKKTTQRKTKNLWNSYKKIWSL